VECDHSAAGTARTQTGPARSKASAGELSEEPKIAERKTRHVTADGEGGWRVKAEGEARASSTHENKTDAVQSAKALAKNHALGQIIITGRDGKIQAEHNYGKDPHPPKG
jgi:hypothetical protein